jgi:hypothetical protein
MWILNYYKNAANTLRGFVYDTNKRTYKKFCLKEPDWWDTIQTGNKTSYEIKQAFKLPCDMDYYLNKAGDLDSRFDKVAALGYTEDKAMNLDFGCIVV